MIAERRYNVTAEQAETFPRHAPVRDERFPGANVCGWRDPEGRLCGRAYSLGALFRTGTRVRRHVPPRGIPHPR